MENQWENISTQGREHLTEEYTFVVGQNEIQVKMILT